MALSTKLPIWQSDLLDLSRANPLLYYHTSGRNSGIHMPSPAPARLYKALLAKSAPSVPLDWVSQVEDPDALERQLGRLRTRTTEDMRDRGLQTLYLAFGLLEWRESKDSAERILSPLVLLPVVLGRAGALGKFTLTRANEDDPELNPVLREKMRNDFGVAVPSLDALLSASADDEDEPRTEIGDLPSILAILAPIFPPEIESRVRVEAHLGRFSFQKLVIYEDLRKHEQQIRVHTILRAIGGDEVAISQPGRMIHAGDIDAQVPAGKILEILDADSSQEEAILAAKSGASFVLQGPPGTGKSQTIANIIAECLGAGEKVLFVSEKMAALEVVWKRLREAELDDFLLNLHDPRQKRDAFLKSLAGALHLDSATNISIREWDTNSQLLSQERNELNEYVRELHMPRFALQRSAYDAYAQLARLRRTSPLEFEFSGAERIDERQLNHLRRLLRDLNEHLDILDRFNSHPWRDTLLQRHSITKEQDIRAHFDRLYQELQASEVDGHHLRTCIEGAGEVAPATRRGDSDLTLTRMRNDMEIATLALSGPIPPLRSWLDAANAQQLHAVVHEAQARATAYAERETELSKTCRLTVLTENLVAVREGLISTSKAAVEALVPSSTRSAYDIALTCRADLEGPIAEGADALAALVDAGREVAAELGLEAPTRGQDAAELGRLAECVLLTPCPPSNWLDVDAFPRIAVLATEAEERSRRIQTMRQHLAMIYSDALFVQDVLGLNERFRTHYGSFLRIFNGQYRSDMRAVRMCVRADIPPTKRAFREIAADVALAMQVLEDERWMREHRLEFVDSLGRFYKLEATDWNEVLQAVRWASGFHEIAARTLPPGRKPEPLLRLITVGGTQLSSLRARNAALSSALDRWHTSIPALHARLRIGALVPSVISADEAPMGALIAGLRSTEAGLHALWNAADTLAQHHGVSAQRSQAPSWSDLCHELRLAECIIEDQGWMNERRAVFGEKFGATFDGFTTDWSALEGALMWAQRLANRFDDGKVPSALAERIEVEAEQDEREELRLTGSRVWERLESVHHEMRYVEGVLPLRSVVPEEPPLDAAPVVLLAKRVEILLSSLPELERLLASRLHLQDCRDAGLGSLLDVALRQHHFPRNIVEIFERRFYSLWLDAARNQSQCLARFSGEKHDATIDRYRRLDKEHMALARRWLRARLLSQRSQALQLAAADRNSPQGRALIRLRQLTSQKRPRGSIRQIVRSVAPVLLDLKPCWMMSPLSVSQYVEESAPIFDVVVFDEASQVRPEEAVSAILRGRRLIVVGDSKQLPPTQFFTKGHQDDDENDDSDETFDRVVEDGRRESILDECSGTDMPSRSLLWHYRSRHEALIAFSNHHFYGDKLITFPNPGDVHRDGVRFEYVEDGEYDFGVSRTNKREAERVVDLIAEHVRVRPHLSLGVVALSAAQQEAIANARDYRLKTDPEFAALAELVDEDRPDGIFIKNLESVQGDERDVIILSIGYGRAPDKRIRYNFGPVNRSGGARRLNVAVTRAREQTIVVTSLRAADLPTSLASEGAQILRAYLDYAERGTAALRETLGASDELTFDSPFEQEVYEALTRKGLRLATQVGCSGYRIDLAVRDPETPSRFVLGIECDGRSYHSAKTARDRDRLRQDHLERMGWTILRIWSSEWRRDPDGQVERVLAQLRDVPGFNSHLRAKDGTTTGALLKDEPSLVADRKPAQQEATATGGASNSTAGHGRESVSGSVSVGIGSNGTYLPKGTPTDLAHSVARWSGDDKVCETCVYYVPLTPSRFMCKRLRARQMSAANGQTPCCSFWKRGVQRT